MDIYGQIAQTIKKMGAAHGVILFSADVKSVDGDTCTLIIGSLELTDVRLRAVVNSENDKIVVTPKAGSRVLAADMSGGSYRDLVVLSYSEIEKVEVVIEQTTCTIDKDGIVMNGGNNGGLVNIDDLVAHINAIENDINNLKTALSVWIPAPNDGGLALKNSIATWFGTPIAKTQKSDFEDTKITH